MVMLRTFGGGLGRGGLTSVLGFFSSANLFLRASSMASWLISGKSTYSYSGRVWVSGLFFSFFSRICCVSYFKFMDETVNYGTLRYSSSNIFSKRFLVIKPLAKRWILRTALINLASMFEFKKPKNLI